MESRVGAGTMNDAKLSGWSDFFPTESSENIWSFLVILDHEWALSQIMIFLAAGQTFIGRSEFGSNLRNLFSSWIEGESGAFFGSGHSGLGVVPMVFACKGRFQDIIYCGVRALDDTGPSLPKGGLHRQVVKLFDDSFILCAGSFYSDRTSHEGNEFPELGSKGFISFESEVIESDGGHKRLIGTIKLVPLLEQFLQCARGAQNLALCS